MNVLLLSMPDSFEHTSSVTMRMPNGALASLAGNVDAHHRVAIADLILVPRSVRETVERLMREVDPDVVGLSIMTFQRGTARKIVALVRALKPGATIVVGGYDPSLASEVYEDPAWDVDVIVRGEGDLTFRELLRALEAGRDLSGVAGLSYRQGPGMVRTPDRAVSSLSGEEVALPNRSARVLTGYTFIGRPIEVVETSRGCTYDCSFCSIIEMRGRNFHTWSIDRVLADIADARARGARAIFIVDDNITPERRAVRGALPRHCRRRFPRYRLPRAGDDVLDRGARGHARAAHARGGIPIRVPRHREHPRRRPCVPEGQRQERAPGGRARGRQRDDQGDRGAPSARHVRCRRPDRRQSQRHARVDRGQPRVRARVRRLALHSAPDAVSGNTDDPRLPRARPRGQRRRG